jgi:hypothetical protein
VTGFTNPGLSVRRLDLDWVVAASALCTVGYRPYVCDEQVKYG